MEKALQAQLFPEVEQKKSDKEELRSTTMTYAHSTGDHLQEMVCRLDSFLTN